MAKGPAMPFFTVQHLGMISTRDTDDRMVLMPKKAEILEVTSNPTIVATQTLSNENSVPGNFISKISEQVMNSVSNEWSNSSSVSVGQSVKYETSRPYA